MRQYVTEINGYFVAQQQATTLRLGLDIAELGKRIGERREQLGASEHLGHVCLVWARIAHPYKDTPDLASLVLVHGVAIGPFDTVTQERHVTWNSKTRPTEQSVFDLNRRDCSEHVRGADARVVEQWVGTDHVIRNSALPEQGPALQLRGDLARLAGAPDTLEPHTFVGTAAMDWARQLVGPAMMHQFRHPALQEFWRQRI